MDREATRRKFLKDLTAVTAAAALILTGCETPAASPPAVLGTKTAADGLQMGDVVIVGSEAFLLRAGQAYPILDLEKYKRFSKLVEYGRRVVPIGRDILSQYPLGKSLLFSYLAIIMSLPVVLKASNNLGVR